MEVNLKFAMENPAYDGSFQFYVQFTDFYFKNFKNLISFQRYRLPSKPQFP